MAENGGQVTYPTARELGQAWNLLLELAPVFSGLVRALERAAPDTPSPPEWLDLIRRAKALVVERCTCTECVGDYPVCCETCPACRQSEYCPLNEEA